MNLIDEIVSKWSDVAFILEEDVSNDPFVNAAKKRLSASLGDKLRNDAELQNKADELGINKDFTPKGYIEARKDAFKNLNISQPVTDKVKKAAQILKAITNSSGGQNWNTLRRMVDDNQTDGMSYNEILRMKDFIDSQDLRYMYDPSIKLAKKNTLKFGNKMDKEGNLDDTNFDMNNITDRHLKQWLSGGERKFNFTEDEAYIEVKRGILNKYLMSSYGIQLDIPNFSLGNKKVKDALLINFTSAFRCPAWNECLLKHACYARNSEGTYYNNEKIGNDKKHLMWEAGHNDPHLMKLIIDMLKAYVVDYGSVKQEVADTIKANKADSEFTSFLEKIGGRFNINTFAQLDYRDMPGSILEILKNHTRVRDIRLNENGDFIAQWLLDEFDKVAGDFRLIGVNTAAYSCRNLNFEGIKNIIINASRITMKGSAIARYFYALPAAMYDAFEDTYNGTNISNGFNAISRKPMPLYSIDSAGNKVPNGNYYYKCPCGRSDFSINGKQLKEVNCYQCHLCYEATDEEMLNKLNSTGGKYIVFVKAHGIKSNLLNNKREQSVAKTVGVSKNYDFGKADDGNAYGSEGMDIDSDTIHESIEQKSGLGQNEAYGLITNNAIHSINEHLNGIFVNGVDSMNEQKKIFWNNFNRLLND